ncbi:ABC transporter permease [Lacihabitans soyangensis]|uniref:ABC transporter permease n=1 Tax=Lacihabitans soyangensis TaxID=869394 RepID=A0AAE3KXW1_9BACT|nr:ABC transporter permease [Lacihabitans soyangensis]MCP9765925.1 ABC transporter permease [Lacihabitans soyangensis]
MIKNYIKIAFRNLWKNKLFSFINIFGLGLALPFALLSLLHLQSTFEFDNFHQNRERIFRIITDEKTNQGKKVSYASSPFLLADKLRIDYPGVEFSTKTMREFGWELSNQLKNLKVNIIYIEPDFFNIFNFKLEKGEYPTEPNTLVISQETAERFYKNLNPIGQILNHPTYGAFKITGVLKPFKKETQFKSDVMVSMATYEKRMQGNPITKSWGQYESFSFVKLRPKVNPASLDLALAQIAEKTNVNLVQNKKRNEFRKQALADISPSEEDLQNNPYVDKWSDIYVNFSIPIMILVLAGFNYTNLTLARSLGRSREVGVRKVMGAVRSQLIVQFIAEAVLIAFSALIVGVLILSLMKEYIHVNWVTWKVDNPYFIVIIFCIFALLLGVTAGSLPAWILSSFQPVKVLKGTLSPASFGKINFRKSLIVIQFIVTLGFIFQIGHMYNQFKYMATENENFNRKGIFNLAIPSKNAKLITQEISENKNVKKIGFTSVPFGGITTQLGIGTQKKGENTASYYYASDRNFIENMNLTFVAGQNLPISSGDSAGNFVIINEKAVEKLNLGSTKEAVGKTIFLNENIEVQVIGVVKNFCHFNYQFEIQPLVFQYNPAMFRSMVIQTEGKTDQAEFETFVKTLWKKQNPYESVSYSWFEEEMYDRYYPAEDMKMMGIACLVILVIAVMGLLGMVIYTTEKRVKEIGIRKVLGASVTEVVTILSWSFLKLLLLAGVIALPIGIFGGLLFNGLFTFNNGLNFSLMAMFFITVLLIAILTIAYYSMRAAFTNPVNSLRAE